MNRLCLFFILVIWISSAIFQKTYAISETSNECKERDVMQRIDSIRNTMELLLQDEKYHELVNKQNEILVLSKKLFNEESAELASEYHCLGYFLSKCEDYEEALISVKKSADIYRKSGITDISEYLSVLEKIAIYYYMLNKTEEAFHAYIRILDEYDSNQLIIDEYYLDILNIILQMSLQYHFNENFDKAIQSALSSQLIYDENIHLLNNIICYYTGNKKPKEALKAFEYADKLVCANKEINELEIWGDILLNVVSAYIIYGEYENAIEKLTLADKVYSKLDNYNSNKHYIYLCLGNIRYEQRQISEAYKIYGLAIEMLSTSNSTNLQKAYIYSRQANCMITLNKIEKASALIEKAMELIEDKCSFATPELINIYNTYSTIMYKRGLFDVLELKLNKIKKICTHNDEFYEEIDLMLGLVYAKTGRFVQASGIADALIAKMPEDTIVSMMRKDEFKEYLKRIISLGTIYSLSKRLSNSIHLLQNAYQQCERYMYNTGEEYGALLNNLSLYNIYLGNYIEAKKYAHLSLAYWQKGTEIYKLHLFETFTNLFLLSMYLEDEENINIYAQKAFDVIQKVQGISFSEIEPYVGTLLKYYILIGELEIATNISEYIICESARLYGANTKSYYNAISVIIYLYIAKHDFNSIISLANAVLTKFDDDIHIARAPFYYYLLYAYIKNGDVDKVTETIVETYKHEFKQAKLFASDFDSKERMFLLDGIQNHIISTGCSFILNTAIPSYCRDSIVETIYNSVLLYKGLNLYIDKNVNKGMYQLNIPTMQKVVFFLKDDECAIEFVQYNNNGVNEYGALILNSHNECHFVPICSEQMINSVDIYDRYNNQNYSKLIWGNIMPFISEKSKIYFAPCGELHKIAIEYLSSLKNEGTMSDDYQIYRLSSTRMLVNNEYEEHMKSIALFGGMDYDKTPDNASDYHNETKAFPQNDYNKLLRGMIFKNLPGTLEEVNQIDSIFQSNKFLSTKYTGTKASERTFKLLPCSCPSIIHIATHGVYWNEEDVKDNNKWLSIIDTNMSINEKNEENHTLLRSVLLFSGAQKSLMGQVGKGNDEDGILTAFELSKIDLKKVDLVVLSACQTGLGDIKGDGVFGLQRGFKKAGVNSLLMSLWEVDDRATQILMVAFYHNLLSGKTKKDSLYLAQKTLRQSENYDAPYYWAGFVLLDGLN